MSHPPVQSKLFGEIEAVLREYHSEPLTLVCGGFDVPTRVLRATS